VVEVEELLPKVEVLQQAGAALTYAEGVLIIADHHPLLGRQRGTFSLSYLVRVPTCAAFDRLLAVLHVLPRRSCVH
jgi:hypothetical protein